MTQADVRPAGAAWQAALWDRLDRTELPPGPYEVRVRLDAGPQGGWAQVPACAGRKAIAVDGRAAAALSPGPVVVPLPAGDHSLTMKLEVSAYERRIACGEGLRVGAVGTTVEGLGLLTFASPAHARGGGRAVVYVPPGHDAARPAPLLVGLHPWNGSIWTYASYPHLLAEARAKDVLLLMPSGLGNSLYTADAEAEVTRAIDALASAVAVDPQAISIWGASMGGAGATTIGLHHPDRFASVTSFFGDSKYDLSTYVRALLPDQAAAHKVNALDVVENARELPVWLIHGQDDATSPIRQSEMLARAMTDRGYHVRFDRVAGMGHAGALVGRYIAQVVDLAAAARAPRYPSRVTYRSVRPHDVGAYGVRLERATAAGDAWVDVEREEDAVHVLRAGGLRGVLLERGALGTSPSRPPPIVVEAAAHKLRVRWGPDEGRASSAASEGATSDASGGATTRTGAQGAGGRTPP